MSPPLSKPPLILLSTLMLGALAGLTFPSKALEPLPLPIGRPYPAGLTMGQIDQCRQFDPDFEDAKPGDHPVCGEFGVSLTDRRPESIHDVMKWSCDLIRLYQPEKVKKEDALADLALACNLRFARLRLKHRLLGGDQTSHYSPKQLLARDQRAKICAPLLFGPRRRLEDELISLNLQDKLTWSNAAFDLELIHRSSLKPEEKRVLVDRLKAGKLNVEGRKNPIRVRETERAFLAVIESEIEIAGTLPVLGTPTRWSLAFQRCVGPQFFEFMTFPKTLGTLAIGMGYDLAPTGKEEELSRWIRNQADSSIEPAELFRVSYKLNGGDIYLTLLTVENVLSRAWLKPERDRLIQTRKLRPIALAIGPQADVFGSWYHFFGTLLYGYVRGEFSAEAVAEIESLGSRILSRERETQESFINRSGAKVGGMFRASLEEWLASPELKTIHVNTFSTEATRFETYIDHTEDLTPSLKKEL